MSNEKILIVEDEKIVAKDIETRLKKLGYVVVAAVTSGEDAIAKATELKPDLILMDIQLKGEMDGIEAAEQIRNEFEIPIVYLTAYADNNTLQRAKITEPFGYIIKPFNERDLYTSIEIALRRRVAEAAIRVALEKEKELSELKSRFWSMVVHEFRNPLSSISTSARLLEGHGHELSEMKQREYFYIIQTAVESMNDLLSDVLALGKVEAGKLEFNPIPLNVVEFCNRIVEEVQFSTGSTHNINFVNYNACSGACLDGKLLWHILVNLLSNAIKYSPQGSQVVLELSCPNGEAIFQVKDQGIGIPLPDQQHLFESFHRARNVGSIPGTGLGLAMVKKCLDLHGGQIQVNSEVGVGTTFTVTLPFRNQLEVR